MPTKLPMALIEFTGPDAVAFAQSQFSNDVPSLANGQWQWNTWLSPQGRVKFFFHLLRDDDQHLRLLMRGGDPIGLRDALKRFVLRSKVDIRADDDSHVYGFGDAADLPVPVPTAHAISNYKDATVFALTANRFISITKYATPDAVDDVSPWTLADIRDGIPTIARALEDAALPQWLGLDRLGAVSVKKGCYPGQEIMSRLHFKGGNKRGLVRLSIDTKKIPDAGSAIASRGESGHVGQIVMAVLADDSRCEVLAILSHASNDAALSLDAEPDAKIELIQRFERDLA